MLVDFGTATLNHVKAHVEATCKAHIELHVNEGGPFEQLSAVSVSSLNETEFWSRCHRPIRFCVAIHLDGSLLHAGDDHIGLQHSLSTTLSNAEVSRV